MVGNVGTVLTCLLTASGDVWFSQWIFTILTCLVMLGSCRCSSAMISKVLSAFMFFHIDGNIYSNLHGLAPACLPNHCVRNVWQPSALGSGEPLGGNKSRTQLLYKSLHIQWNINNVGATPCKTNEISTILCGPSSVHLEMSNPLRFPMFQRTASKNV